MSHGVVQFSGGLVYQGQSGALNESFADVFGTMTRQFAESTDVYEADWLIGKGILGPGINGEALRSMKMPGTAYSDALLGQDPQPYHMDLYVNTPTTTAGSTSTRASRTTPSISTACCSAATHGRRRAGSGTGRCSSSTIPIASFADWAIETMQAAIALFATGSREVMALRRAWKLVGISV